MMLRRRLTPVLLVCIAREYRCSSCAASPIAPTAKRAAVMRSTSKVPAGTRRTWCSRRSVHSSRPVLRNSLAGANAHHLVCATLKLVRHAFDGGGVSALAHCCDDALDKRRG